MDKHNESDKIVINKISSDISMKQESIKIKGFDELKELYGNHGSSNSPKPGSEPKGIKPKETPQIQSRIDDND